jgi:hypothetical protein
MDGLSNLGNSCYMNSILIALLHQPAFVNDMASPLWLHVLEKASNHHGLAAGQGHLLQPSQASNQSGSAITNFLDVTSPPLLSKQEASSSSSSASDQSVLDKSVRDGRLTKALLHMVSDFFNRTSPINCTSSPPTYILTIYSIH